MLDAHHRYVSDKIPFEITSFLGFLTQSLAAKNE